MNFAETHDEGQSTLDKLSTIVGFVRELESETCDPLAIDKPYEFAEQDRNDSFALLV